MSLSSAEWKPSRQRPASSQPSEDYMRIIEQRIRELENANDPNTRDKDMFIFESVLWALVSMFVYRFILFRCIDHYSFKESKLILWLIVFLCCAVSVIVEMKTERRAYNLWFNTALGFGLYTVFVYYPLWPGLIRRTLTAGAVVFFLFLVALVVFRWKNGRETRRVYRFRVVPILWMAQKIAAVCLTVIMLTVSMHSMLDWSDVESSVQPATRDNLSEQTIANHMDTLTVLGDGSWPSLSIQDKLDVLQTVANIEQNYLGLSTELNVEVRELEGTLLGGYADTTRQIYVDMESLQENESWEVIDTICHEAYHAYERRLIDLMNSVDEESRRLLIFDRIKQYEEEFAHYTQGSDDKLAYYFQRCEMDARKYAKQATADYRDQIEEYLSAR